jgi:putative membrane protein
MHSISKYLLLALLSGASMLNSYAQDKPVKEAEKINKKRSKIQAKRSPYTKEQLRYDADFAVMASSSDMLEVALGKLAQQKAIALDVKDWGKQMIQEHEESGRRLSEIAGRAGIQLPVNMGVDDRKVYDDIDDRKYLGFDKKYMRDLQELHERTIKRYAEATTKLSNPELLAFATEMLPKLRAHEAKTAELFKAANERK